MSRILIPYGTTEGQSGKIAEFIAGVIKSHGHEVDSVEISSAPRAVPDSYDGVIVGASIHMGKHDKKIVKFVQKNRRELERLPSAFFSVSLAAHGDPSEATRYVEEFEQQTGWQPTNLALFSGALLYTRYGFIKRRVMRKIATERPGALGTDTTRDYVYTEWDGVKRFAEDFLTELTTSSSSRHD